MAIVKKNIWLIFYTFLFISIIFFTIVSYLKWQNTYHEQKLSQENHVNLIATSTHALFATHELLLDIMGRRFIEDETYKNNIPATKALDKLLKLNPAIFAFGFAAADGQLLHLTSHPDASNLPNLKELPQSRDSFLETLESHHMVLGRTYFFNPLQEWVIPIRRAIRDDSGTILAVMTGGLRLQDAFEPLLKSLNDAESHVLAIVRDIDGYPQYQSNYNKMIYTEPSSHFLIQKYEDIIFKTYSISPQTLREKELIVSFLSPSENEERILTSLKYDKTYKLWTIIETRYSIILEEFSKSFLLYFSIFGTTCLAFLFLVRIVVKAEKKREAELLFQATHDTLTNLPNRLFLQHNIHHWIKNDKPFSVLYLDVDDFKNINDSFGHAIGDALLLELSQRLKAYFTALSKNPFIIRYGGDEFVIFLHVTEPKALRKLLENLNETLEKEYIIQEMRLLATVSMGVAKFPDDGKTLDTLLRATDIAMFASKKTKNSIHIFESSMEEAYLKNVYIEQELRKALQNKELFMVYQPQFDKDGHFYGVESLVRWNSEKLGTVPPIKFIPIAEATGQMPCIGRFILSTSLEEMKSVHAALGRYFHTSINISIKQFLDVTFLEHLLQTIEQTAICRVAITLEVTENLFIEDVDYILPLLNEIRALDIEISMDDFGTGYSSLSILRKLPINELKIDKSFVDELSHDETAQTMVQNIIAIGKNLGMHILAEGVETLEQKEILTQLGCDRFQGYYFSKPLSKEDLLEFLKTSS